MSKKADIPEIVHSFIQRRNLFAAGGTILAAVSGGADSLCLLLILKKLGYALQVAHFDHGLRPESGEDAEAVRRIADRLGLPFVLGKGDVRGDAGRDRLTLEEAAREARYDFLFRAGHEAGAASVATGHTKSDQAETVLMHLIRGSGLRGLGGIRPLSRFSGSRAADPLSVVRPLLCLTHSQTVEFCRQAGWIPLEDPTNRDTAFARNKVRHELIPVLEGYNPSVVDSLSRLADIAQTQEEYIEREAEEVWNRSACRLSPGLIRLPIGVFRESAEALRQALVRRAIRETTGAVSDLAWRHVEQVIEFASKPTASRRMDVALGVEVALEYDNLVFRSPSNVPPAPEWEGALLPVPGKLSMRFPDWEWIVEEGENPHPGTKDAWTARIDPDRIRPPLSLRKRRAGDHFIPEGLPGPVKLNDFLASHHLGYSERDHWPLVCDAGGIIWVPGYRLKAGIAASDRTAKTISIQIKKPA